MNTILCNQILTDSIYVDIHNMNHKNINKYILNEIKNKIGDNCNDNGYSLKDTIEIINKNLGKIVTINSVSKLLYNIRYKTQVINPTIGCHLDCYVDNISKMGIIAYIKLNDIIDDYDGLTTLNESPLIIIIPSNNSTESISEEDKITIEVQASRIKFNTNKIQVIGKII